MFEETILEGGRKGNLSTGTLIKAQVKGSEKREPKQALTVRLPLKTVRYYERLALPVLLVRYHAPTDTLYARMFHKFEITPGQRRQNTVTLKLAEEDIVTPESPGQWLADRIVVVDPERLEIPSVRGEWTTFQYPIVIRNVSKGPLYDVGFAAVFGAATTLQPDRLQFLPRFKADDTNLAPIGFTYLGTESGRTYKQHKFVRMEPETSYPFIVRYDADPHEEGEPATRTVQFLIASSSDEPSPVLISHT